MRGVADCTDAAALERLLGRVEEALGPVEILAAFAGGGGRPRPLTEIDEATWRDVLDANLTSTFLTVRAMLPGMLARRRGCILTMASTAGRQPGGASAPYAAAKAAVIMFTRHVARELGPQGVRANCLAPSAILTERSRAQMSEEQQRQLAQVFPLGRAGEPEDVAAAAVFLASDGAAWLTGITLDVAGGRITG